MITWIQAIVGFLAPVPKRGLVMRVAGNAKINQTLVPKRSGTFQEFLFLNVPQGLLGKRGDFLPQSHRRAVPPLRDTARDSPAMLFWSNRATSSFKGTPSRAVKT